MLGGELLLLNHWTGAELMGPMQSSPPLTSPVLGGWRHNLDPAADCGRITAHSELILSIQTQRATRLPETGNQCVERHPESLVTNL
jgi:hypothetical protein